MAYKHWQQIDIDGVVVRLTFDRKDGPNTISFEVLDELDSIIDGLLEQTPQGVIFASAKPDHFCYGADVKQFSKFDSESIETFLNRGHEVFDKIEKIACKTVAEINGHCLGGGLELALACDYRVVESSIEHKLGLPEIMLGIIPGWGGTVRMPSIIGSAQALGLMAAGKTLSPFKAKKIGLVDLAVPARVLQRSSIGMVRQKPHRTSPPWYEVLFSFQPVRRVLTFFIEKKLMQIVDKHYYPAPYALLKHWEKYYIGPKAFRDEIKTVEELVAHASTQKLMRVFHLRELLRSKVDAPKFKHVHVVGAGVMGGDIAVQCALKGYQVTLQDTQTKSIGATLKRGYALAKKKYRKAHLVQQIMDRLSPDPQGLAVSSADLVIEAVVEDLEVKKALFKHLESSVKPSCVLATNTSSMTLSQLKTALKEPNRLVGIHFFNPVPKMPLVELVYDTKTPKQVVNTVQDFILSLGKLSLHVKSSPGFLVNRILIPYLLEAFEMVEEGLDKDTIDKAAREFGLPMGPVELADHIGLDVCHLVGDNLSKLLKQQMPDVLAPYLERGELGKKTKKGFYAYKKGKPIRGTAVAGVDRHEIVDRLVLRMIIEAQKCLDEKLVTDMDALDAGMIFGTGFPPFRGGLMHYACSLGQSHIQQLSEKLSSKFGERFQFQFKA